MRNNSEREAVHAETDNRKATKEVIEADAEKRRAEVDEVKARTQEIRNHSAVLMTEYNKNQAATRHFNESATTTAKQRQVMDMHIEEASNTIEAQKERLKALRNQGKIDESEFGMWMAVFDRVMGSLSGATAVIPRSGRKSYNTNTTIYER